MRIVQPTDFTTQAKTARVLVVDNDPAVQASIVGYLTENGLRANAVSGRQGLLQALVGREPDLVLLDLPLDREDGLEVLRDLRARSLVPVILFNSNIGERVDRVVALELGADDYLDKSFGLRELLARIRAILRRRSMDRIKPAKPYEDQYRFEGWTFDQRQRTLTSPSGEAVALTKSDFALLSAFVQAPGRTLSREHLLQATRIHENVFDRSIDVQILRLRRKLEPDPHAPRFIMTERGVGCRFDAEVAAA